MRQALKVDSEKWLENEMRRWRRTSGTTDIETSLKDEKVDQ